MGFRWSIAIDVALSEPCQEWKFLSGVLALWQALETGDEEAVYRIYFPLCALVTLQVQAGLDGFLAIEKHVLVKRGLFRSELRRAPR